MATVPYAGQLVAFIPYGMASSTQAPMRTPVADFQSWPVRYAGGLLEVGGSKAVSGITKVAGVPAKRYVLILTQPPGSVVLFEAFSDNAGVFTFPKLAAGSYLVIDVDLDAPNERALVYDWVVAV